MISASTAPQTLLPIFAIMAGLACVHGACSLRSLDYLKNGHKQDGAVMDSAEMDVADLSTPSLDTAIVDMLSQDTATGSGGTVGTGGMWATGGDQSTGGAIGTGGLVGAGGTSATGGVIATGGNTETGGVSATGGDQATGGATGTDGSSSVTCSGAVYSGICWYLAATGESCTQACASHGGPSSLAASHVGTTAQGGSRDECAAILALLGVAGTVQSSMSISGVGCISYIGTTASGPGLYWVSTPAFSETASMEGAQPACGCLQ
jgi:hypothetical protein